MRELLLALKKLKDYGVVHRDLKYLNFLYNLKERRGILIDFGCAEILKDKIM